jgi:hypothetical protein
MGDVLSEVEEYGYGSLIRFTHEVIRYKTDGNRTWVTMRDRQRYDVPPPLHSAPRYTWRGEPLDPDGWDPGRPTWKDERLAMVEPRLNAELPKPVARLRRVPHYGGGLVIGSTRKQEGVVESSYADEVEGYSGYLSVQRIVTVLEVALAPEQNGKARVILVWKGDVL